MSSDSFTKVSVIIPVYNTSKYLDRLIESLVNQSLKEMEFIFVNDGSTDDSLSVLGKYAKMDSRIKVIDKENEGVSVARNTGLSKAQGQFIGFVDSDDFIAENMYEILYEKAIKTNSDIVCCGYYYWPAKKHMCNTDQITISNEQAIEHLVDNKKIGMSACSKLFINNCVEGVNFPPQYRINEDRFFAFQAFTKSKVVTVIGDPLYYYCTNDNSVSHSEFNKNRLDGIEISKKMYEMIKLNYPSIEPNSYADIIRVVFHTLVAMYKNDAYKKFNLEYKELVTYIKKCSLSFVKNYTSKSVYLQLIAIKYCERLFRVVKKLVLKRKGGL